MSGAFRVTFLELLLLKGIHSSKFKFKVGPETWTYDDKVDQHVGTRNVKKAIDAAIADGLVTVDGSKQSGSGGGIKLTSLGIKLLKAAEPEFYKEHAA